jgi:hypothetical protein
MILSIDKASYATNSWKRFYMTATMCSVKYPAYYMAKTKTQVPELSCSYRATNDDGLCTRHHNLVAKASYVFVCCDGTNAMCAPTTADEACELGLAHQNSFVGADYHKHYGHVVAMNSNIGACRMIGASN